MASLKSILIVLFVVLVSQTGRAANGADTLTDAAWRAWEAPDYPLAEKQFRAAIAADPASTRAYAGLALLENMREKYRECWDALRLLSDKEPNIYPYVFSIWQTLRFRLKNESSEVGLLDYLEKLSTSADDRGVLSAQTAEALEEYYRERHEFSKANDWHLKINAISDWMLIGPFENVSASGYDKMYPPEAEFNPTATYEGKGGVPASWFPIVSTVPNTWIDFTRHFGFRKSVFYANTFVYSPTKRKAHLRVGTSGSVRAFLNDEMVLESFDENNNDLDTYVAATELQQGWNRILIKCGYSEIDKCNFLVRVTDEHGQRIEDLRVSTDVQSYTRKPSAPATVLGNAFEAYFKEQLELFPDRAENYALLAHLYLRDDKAPQAERVLRSALKRWPRCSLFYTLMMEAYQRGEKNDEIEELLIKLSAIDDHLPQVLVYRINEALRNEEYQKVEELLAQLKNQDYNPEYVCRIEMELVGKRKEMDKLVALIAEAHAKYPLNWEFAGLQAQVESDINHEPEKAAGVVNAFLAKSYGTEQLYTMSTYYLKAGKLDKWEAAMKEALVIAPTATGYFNTMGLVYQLAKDYKKAEEAFHHALALCPNNSSYWSKLAEIYKSTNRTEEAKAAYGSALKFDARDFDSREALRSLEGKNPIFSAFTSYSIDSLISTAPSQKDYENDNGVILLDDTKRVVFEQGASMVSDELLVKTFSPKGIDAWKEYYINYNAYNEVLIVEKAVTIKRDRTEVKADISNGHIVFKSLEPNDCIYLKWKLKNYYNGMLANHFWDTHYFNGFYPSRISRYSLMVPKDVQFTHRTQLTPNDPLVRQTNESVLYEWRLAYEPAIRYEQGMPEVRDVGKMLYVSSLPSWDYVSSWFSDLARTKTRTTCEIKDQVASILDGKGGMSDEGKAKVIHDFITENIHYSSVSFRQSAYVPQKARDVLVQRMGDCKDMATLYIAMLREAGIDAHYVLVNTWDDGFNRNTPPSIEFNHCIAGVDLKSGVKYIDLTAANFPFGSIPPVDKGAFSLAIQNETHSPLYLAQSEFHPNSVTRTTTASLNDDNSLTYTCSSRRTGAPGARLRSRYRNKSKTESIKSLTEILSNDYPNIQVKELAVGEVDLLDSVLVDSHECKVPQFISELGEFKLTRVPWADKLSPTEALSYESRNYPYNLIGASDTLMETLRLKLPAGYTLREVPKAVTLSCSVGSYSVDYKYAKGELTGKRAFVYKKTIVNPEEYFAYKKFYNDALKEDNRQLLLKKGK